MSKNWKQRIRDIAANNPDKLHPMLKGMMASPDQSKAWDRVSWYINDDSDTTPTAAVRPILAMLQWLNSQSLLTGQGKSILKSIGKIDPINVALTRDLVEPTAWAFLDSHYQRWYDTCAINYAIDESMPFDDHTELDSLWANSESSA